MYIVKRTRGKVPAALTKSFKTYETARSAVRKYLRTKPNIALTYDLGWMAYRNPSSSDYGFHITKAA